MTMLAATKLSPVADESTFTVAMLCDPAEPLETFRKNQLIRSPVTNGYGMYSRREANDGRRKFSILICLNSSGRIEVLSNIYVATGLGFRRFLNVLGPWGSGDAESRIQAALCIDGSKEKYESNE